MPSGQVTLTTKDAPYRIESTVSPTSGEYEGRFGSLSPGQAAVYWRGLNIGLGYRARLLNARGKTVATKVS